MAREHRRTKSRKEVSGLLTRMSVYPVGIVIPVAPEGAFMVRIGLALQIFPLFLERLVFRLEHEVSPAAAEPERLEVFERIVDL